MAMIWFALPLTVITLLIVTVRSLRKSGEGVSGRP